MITHVSRSSTGVRRVLWFEISRYSKVCESQVSLIVEDQVLRFDVSVYDSVFVNELEGENQASHEEFYQI